MKITKEMIAYAQGYWDGRHEGVDCNPYDHADPRRYIYATAYEAGVGDYCRFDEEKVYD